MSTELDAERNNDALWFADNYELRVFRDYLEELDRFLSKEISECIAGLEKAKLPITYLTEHEEDLSEPSSHEYFLSMYENFRNLFLKSFIMNLYTVLESGLVERCRQIERGNAYVLSVKDLAGSGISQSMNYLIKLHRIEYSLEQSAEWMQIQSIRRLRNCITHNGGRLVEGTEQIRQLQDYIKGEPTIRIEEETGNIVLSKHYCEKVLLTIERYLYVIDKAIFAAEISAHGL